MSRLETVSAIRELVLDDELLQSSGFCRRSAEKMAETARAADVTPPHAIVEILAWPNASPTAETHYALRVSDANGNSTILNPVPAPKFPQYIGDASQAPGLLQQMIPVSEVL